MICATVMSLVVTAAQGQVLQAFEGDGFGDWVVEGEAFGAAPVVAKVDGLNGELKGFSNASLVCSAHGGDAAKGSLTSPEFEIGKDHLAFLIAGGNHPGRTAVQLLDGDRVLMEATGDNGLECRKVVWDVKGLRGKRLKLRILDDESGGWGVIAADHFMLTDSAEPEFPPTSSDGRARTGGLVATDALPGMTIPEGSTARVVADHATQGVTSPTALAFDEQGVLYIAETHRFRFGVEDDRERLYWYLDDIASQTVGDRAKLLEKWREQAPLAAMTEKSEYIRRLAGQGEDGRFKEAGVFAEDFNDQLDGTAAGVFAYEGTVFLANIPKIYALRDRDGDGKAEERGVIQDGFGVRYSLSGHDLNGFALGPDGRIYGTVGDRGFSFTTREGVKYHFPGEGAIFRFDPDGTNFEVVHLGLRNPKEIAFDEYGNGISVDNNSDQGDESRVVYMVEGADSGWRMEHQAMHTFHRQIGLEERPPNRWMQEEMWDTPNDKQPAYLLPPVANLTAGPSGLTYHPGTGFLESEAGRFLICDYRGGAAASGIWSFEVKPKGAGMEMTDARQFNWGAAVTDVEYSWDGRLFVTDFVDGWKSHDDGRVYEIEADEMFRPEAAARTAELIAEGFDQRGTEELVQLLTHPDMRVRLRAQLAITRKSDGLTALSAAAKGGELIPRLHAIWGMGVIARRGPAALPDSGDGFASLPDTKQRENAQAELMPLLKDGDAEVRAQAIKVLGESGIAGDRINFGALLEDPSARVRMYAAIAAGRTAAVGSIPFVWQMIESNEDKDPYLRHAGSYAISKLCIPLQVTAMRTSPSASVRLAAVVALGRMNDPRVADFLYDSDPRVVNEAIIAIHDRGIEEVRPRVAALLTAEGQPERTLMMWRRLLHSAYRVGDAENLGRVVATALDDSKPDAVRHEALRLLREWNQPHPVDQSSGRHSPLPARDPAIAKNGLQPQVAGLLGIDGELLEEAIEVVETHGLDFSDLSDERLKALVMNFRLPGKARAKALDLFAERKPADLEEFLVSLSGGGDDELALSAIGELIALNPTAAVAAIGKAVGSDSARRQQAAWILAGKLEGAEISKLMASALRKLAEDEGKSPAALELIEVAGERDDPAVKEALAAYQSAVAASSDPLAKWNPSLLGGDPAAGRQLFESSPGGQCMRCHTVDGGHAAAQAGPNLAGAGLLGDRRYLLESLINPGATVADGFGVVAVSLKSGESTGGVLASQNDQQVVIDIAGEKRTIARAEISSMTPPVSAMPPMEGLLKPAEVRDLVAWLTTCTKP